MQGLAWNYVNTQSLAQRMLPENGMLSRLYNRLFTQMNFISLGTSLVHESNFSDKIRATINAAIEGGSTTFTKTEIGDITITGRHAVLNHWNRAHRYAYAGLAGAVVTSGAIGITYSLVKGYFDSIMTAAKKVLPASCFTWYDGVENDVKESRIKAISMLAGVAIGTFAGAFTAYRVARALPQGPGIYFF